MQQKNGARENYILNTNILLHDPGCIYDFEGSNMILPMVILGELDSLKSHEDLCDCQARQAVREPSKIVEGRSRQSIQAGIPFEKNILFQVGPNGYHNMLEYTDKLDLKKNGNRILLTTLSIQKKGPETTTILVSKDICMCLKAGVLGLKSEDYEADRIILDDLYQSHTTTVFSSKEIDKLYESGLKRSKKLLLYPNQLVLVHARNNPEHTAIIHFDGEKLVPLQYENRMVWGLTPLNLEQKMAFELMMDDTIKFVSITSGTDSGKIILATAVTLEKVVEQRAYREVVFVRPVVPVRDDIGFLPENKEEKPRPWMGSFYDAIENLMHRRRSREPRKNCAEDNVTIDSLIEHFKNTGVINMKTFTYMRGRTLSSAIVIVDGAQGAAPYIAKLMLIRASQNPRFIFIGDPTDNQIDNSLVNSRSNGLAYLVERLKNSNLTGHITLNKIERGPLAKLVGYTL